MILACVPEMHAQKSALFTYDRPAIDLLMDQITENSSTMNVDRVAMTASYGPFGVAVANSVMGCFAGAAFGGGALLLGVSINSSDATFIAISAIIVVLVPGAYILLHKKENRKNAWFAGLGFVVGYGGLLGMMFYALSNMTYW